MKIIEILKGVGGFVLGAALVLLSLLFSAIPIIIALLVVVWILRSCSGK